MEIIAFVISIGTSLVSALIFWLIFSHIPKERRKKRIRPLIEYDMYRIYLNVFSIFELVMKHDKSNMSLYQNAIRWGDFNSDDILNGLQNKCANTNFLYDQNVSDKLIAIGEDLHTISNRIALHIENVYKFIDHLKPNEIDLIERLKLEIEKIKTFKDRVALTVIGKQKFYPIESNMSGSHANFISVFKIYVELRKTIHKHKYFSDSRKSSILWSYYNKQYRRAIRKNKKYGDETPYYQFILASAYAEIRKYKKSKKVLHKISESAYTNIFSYRNFIKDTLKNEVFKNMLNERIPQDSQIKIKYALEHDERLKANFLKQAKEIQQYHNLKNAN